MPIVRLRPGATRAAAAAELALFAHRLAAEPPEDTGIAFHIWPMSHGAVSRQGGANPLGFVSGLFLALATLVLLLAAANIMGVLLARARTREREMAVRSALGASRRRLARQVLLEALVLAALPPSPGYPVTLDFSFDGRVYAFGFAMALLMAIVAGLLPAWRAAAAEPNQALRGREVSVTGSRPQRLRSTLVAAQMAGSLALLIVGGLFLRSLVRVQSHPVGFEANHLWVFELDAGAGGYTTAQGADFYARLLPAVRALPGIQSAALARFYPFGPEGGGGRIRAGGSSTMVPDNMTNTVSPGYFSAMGVPLLRGRGFTARDTAASPAVAVVSTSMARALWPGESALGRQVGYFKGPPSVVVGVAGNMVRRFSRPDVPQIYFPLSRKYYPREILQVRTDAGVATPVPEVEHLLRRLAPAVPLGVVQSLPAVIQGLSGLYVFRLGARLATALGLLGLFLAVMGVYGVVAYDAAQRTHEVGVRVALGARPLQVLAASLRRAAVMIGAGMAAGLFAAAAFGKLAGALLVGVGGLDPLTFIAASMLLALRASRADPLAALRCE